MPFPFGYNFASLRRKECTPRARGCASPGARGTGARGQSVGEAGDVLRRLLTADGGELNSCDAMVVKVKGEFAWHKHDDTDHFFLVLKGQLDIQLRERTVSLGPGDVKTAARAQDGVDSPAWARQTQGSGRHTNATLGRARAVKTCRGLA